MLGGAGATPTRRRDRVRMRNVGVEDLARAVEELERPGPVEDQADGGPRVVASGNGAVPLTTLAVVDRALPRYRLNVLTPRAGSPPARAWSTRPRSSGSGCAGRPRWPTSEPAVDGAGLWATMLPPTLVVLHTTPPRAGRVSLGIEVNVLPAAVEQVRARGGLVVAQVNPRMPYTYGDAELDADLIDLALEVDGPLPVHAPSHVDDAARLIGERVATACRTAPPSRRGSARFPTPPWRACPSGAGCACGPRVQRRGAGARSAGALDGSHPLTASFLFGSEELYAWVDGNDRVVMRRTEVANDPATIARQQIMTSINTALQVDLFGQVNASRVGERIHSGFGGATDFLVGALHSAGGQALVALRSWHPKADVSTIVPLLDQPATSFQPTAVITEHGVAAVGATTNVTRPARSSSWRRTRGFGRSSAKRRTTSAWPDVPARPGSEARRLRRGRHPASTPQVTATQSRYPPMVTARAAHQRAADARSGDRPHEQEERGHCEGRYPRRRREVHPPERDAVDHRRDDAEERAEPGEGDVQRAAVVAGDPCCPVGTASPGRSRRPTRRRGGRTPTAAAGAPALRAGGPRRRTREGGCTPRRGQPAEPCGGRARRSAR